MSTSSQQEAIDAYVATLLAAAPPLTAAQRDTIGRALRPGLAALRSPATSARPGRVAA